MSDLRPEPETLEISYQSLVEAITDYAIYMLDPTGKVTSWNAGAVRFKGYAAREIIGQNFSRFYGPEDRESGLPAKALATAARDGRFENEGWRYRKDGTRFWAHVIIDPIRAEDGHLLGFAKITRDLTERRAAETTLRKSEEQFRLLVQSVTDYAIFMLDADGYVTNWNAGAERIKQYRADEIVGQHFSRFYTPEDRAIDAPARALRIASTEGRFENEGCRVRKDGTQFWAHVVIDPIYGDDGTVIAFAKITRDITERRKARRALDDAREALFQSQKLDAIGQLTGGVAHDFNNLLMAILGSLELLRKRLPDDDRARSLLDNAVQGAERGATLTQRMLSFARKQELQVEAIHVPALIEGMTGLIEHSLGPMLRVSTRFAPDLPRACSDVGQLEMAILNLVLNARDSMPEGGDIVLEAAPAVVTADGDPGLAPGEYVQLAIIDNGPGMDSATLARATEPFFTTKGVGKGTGLGLPMVHGLAEQSGGGLRLSSVVGKGTRAEIWLPAADHESPTARPPAVERQDFAPVRSRVILVVDDDELVLHNIVALLEDMGHLAIPAASGAEALDVLSRRVIDFVITDYAMPGMTGLQLIDRAREERPNLRVALVTGYAELSPGKGGDVIRLAKPYSQADLARLIRTLESACDRPSNAA